MDRRKLLGFLGFATAATVVGAKKLGARPSAPAPAASPEPEVMAPPIGTILAWAGQRGDQIMDNWMLCDGRSLTRAHYHELFKVIGIFFGGGDGHSTFAIPDMRPRLVMPDYAGRAYAGVDHREAYVAVGPSHSHSFSNALGATGSIDGGGHIHGVTHHDHHNVPPFQPTLAIQHLIKVL